jgi:SAM-dependent methyltransferase
VFVPKLSDSLHTDMLANEKREGQLYGMHWGDPQSVPFLKFVRDRFIMPHVDPDHHAVEIGPGGGRWTRYMLLFARLYAVDYHQELLDELARSYRVPHLVPVRNNGADFPGIPPQSIDFLFSFGVFVHLDTDIIDAYLGAMRAILRPGATAVIQYSDKTKQRARDNASFSENTPDVMRAMVLGRGYAIIDENLTALPHSSVVRFTPGPLA